MNVRRNYEYFQKLRRSDPKLYLTKKVQLDMHRQAMKQGASFYDKAPKPEPTETLDFVPPVPAERLNQHQSDLDETLQQEEENE